jgi:hypothetical protein
MQIKSTACHFPFRILEARYGLIRGSENGAWLTQFICSKDTHALLVGVRIEDRVRP